MGLTNPSRGVVDFDDWRALKPVYEAASEAGIFVVLRPGERTLPLPISVADGARDRSLCKHMMNAVIGLVHHPPLRLVGDAVSPPSSIVTAGER